MCNKRDALSSLIDTCTADIVILTETWLSSKIADSEIFECEGMYKFYRFNRDSRSGGGVLIAVRDSIISSVIPLNLSLEFVCARVHVRNKDFIFCACYRPPASSSTFCSELHDVLNRLVVRFPSSSLLLLGDFNFPTINWKSDTPTVSDHSLQALSFLSLCLDFNLKQLVQEPTRCSSHSSNVLDLILTTTPELVSPLTYLPGLSDHCVIQFDLQASASSYKAFKIIRDYRNADFVSINNELDTFLTDYISRFHTRTVEENWSLFKQKVSDLTDQYIPLKRIRSNSQAPWFNARLKRLRNKKKRLFRRAKLTKSAERWDAYEAADTEYKQAVAQSKQEFYQCTLFSLLKDNPRKFWSVVSGSRSSAVELCDANNVPVDLNDCCNVLNDVFASYFSHTTPTCYPIVFSPNYSPMFPVSIDSFGVDCLIQKLKISACAGIDGINSKFLKSTATYSSLILSEIFSQSLQCCTLPNDWKVGKVVPLHKSGTAHSPLNYRPISLTSVPCKLLEHIIYSHLVAFLESNSFFTNCQHGFRKFFSCETQLVSFTNDLMVAIDAGLIVDCIFLDFAKAFDSVSHDLLLLKLSKLNIDPNILGWIKCFLSNRSQYVSVNGHDSSTTPVTSGVPQGSVLGPLLFLVYINDLPSQIVSSIKLFADDCVLYRVITSAQECAILQSDLDVVSSWCAESLMKLNVTKCKSMRVSRLSKNTDPAIYILNDIPLDAVASYKYLGIHITHNLSWNMHVDYVSNNANRMLGFLRRHFRSANLPVKLQLYKALVRPKLEYACSVWDPGHVTLSHILESVQNRAARFILSNYSRTASVSSMKTTLDLPDLALRRKYFRLCLFHKVYYSNPILKNQLLFHPSYVSPRHDHQCKVGTPTCHTNIYFDSFIPRTSSEWNHLPASIVSIQDVTYFKKLVNDFICTTHSSL